MNSHHQSSSTRCSVCAAFHPPNACPASAGARVGTVLEGKYQLVRLIGQGGMGEIYEGSHRVIGRRVAVKFLHGQYVQDADAALRFESEARVAGGSEHENVAGVYDVGTLPDGTRYLVMEFLDGEDVDKLVRREAPLPISRSASIVIQACRGLDAVHKRGIVHRDLKPANLFVARRAGQTDLVKVLDFGIAKLKTADGGAGTKTGTAIGTAHYMSPEQARGERTVDARSDVYSLGVVLYELLSGKKPHDGDSLLQLLHKVMTQPPVPLESVRPGLPDALHAVVRRAMARDVAERYGTVAELGEALLPFAGWPVARSRNARPLVVGGTVGTTVVLAMVAFSILRTGPGSVRPAVEPSSALASLAAAAPSAPASPAPIPVTSLAQASPAIPDASAPAVAVADGAPSTSPWVRPAGNRTPPSGRPAPTTPVGPTQPVASTSLGVVSAAAPTRSPTLTPTPAPPPPGSTLTERGDNPF